MKPFTVRVPASTSNLGSGFDTISAALSLYLTVRVEPLKEQEIQWLDGPEPESVFPHEGNLVCRAFEDALALLGTTARCGAKISMNNPIPLQRGLGSSAAAIVAGIKIAERLSGVEFDEQRVFRAAFPLEGHPDNLSASLLGGWVLSWVKDDTMAARRLPVALRCQFILAVPQATISTREARAIVPERYPRNEVTYNLQRCALLVHALHTGDKSLLREATSDRLHQPYRSRLVPGVGELLTRKGLPAGLEDSVLGVCISGSGSAVVALVEDRPEEVGCWMVETLAAQGTGASYLVLDLDQEGAKIMDRKGVPDL